MRRPPGWNRPALALAAATLMVVGAGASRPEQARTVEVGTSAAYKRLGALPLMHEGRVKPLDTVAREEIKLIYTREAIKLPGDDGQPGTTWSPVAAFLDWTVRPKYWDGRPIIAVEYLPLKRLILADEVRTGLEAVAGKAETSASDRDRIKAVAGQDEIDAASIRSVVRDGKLAEADALALEKLAERIGEETKWLSPDDLESADVAVDGKKMPFLTWLDALTRKSGGGSMGGARAKLSDLEQKAFEVGVKLGHYRAIRDKQGMGMVPLLVMPRPANQAMLNYSAEAYKKAVETQGQGLDTLELESAGNLNQYFRDLPIQDHAMPGTDPKFDARYTAWLREKSAWVPLGVLREAPIDDLAKAGYPVAKVEAFRSAFRKVEEAEMANPGHADDQPALALIEAASDLGRSVNETYYPGPDAMAREVHFNELGPFFQAPKAYGLALLALIFSLVVANFGSAMKLETTFGRLSRALYLVGVASLAGGIGLEAYGFYLRIRITNWAPVTNMYETVIWVCMITSILGFVLESIYRKTSAALAAAGVALVGTALAANVSLLDPQIHTLPPVLRSNFWLTIHVLTIVSSYAAFALAMGLGVAATTLYLTTTYKRSAGPGELLAPLLPGLPLLAAGWYGLRKFYAEDGSPSPFQAYGFWPSLAVLSAGGVMVGAAVFSALGEAVNRAIARRSAGLKGPGVAGEETFRIEESSPAHAMVVDAEARDRAMRATAARIKPMANFIYRSMQVGILLVAAGTFLGGWWADVSWGRFWGWDPKEVWALITLLVYLMPLHGRFAGWVNTFWLVMSSVACFLSVLMAWYGVNFVLGVGLHSYGAGAGGQREVFAATVVTLGFAAGAFWRRHLGSKLPASAA